MRSFSASPGPFEVPGHVSPRAQPNDGRGSPSPRTGARWVSRPAGTGPSIAGLGGQTHTPRERAPRSRCASCASHDLQKTPGQRTRFLREGYGLSREGLELCVFRGQERGTSRPQIPRHSSTGDCLSREAKSSRGRQCPTVSPNDAADTHLERRPRQ